MSNPDDAIASYKTALDQLPQQKTGDCATIVMNALLARDRLAAALSSSKPSADYLAAVLALDERLRQSAITIDRIVGRTVLAGWRASLQPPAAAWWWRLDESAAEAEKPSALWGVLTAFLLTISLSLTAEIARRFLAVGADFVGVFSTLVQGFLTFMAGRSLTDAGQRRIESLLSSLNFRRSLAPAVTALLALIVLLGVISLRLSLPSIAGYYSDRGARLQQEGRLTEAIMSYQRATSLTPNYTLAHYNLGSVYEQSMAYDLAILSYQAALRSNSTMIPAYNNLARVYLAQNNFGNALVLLNSGLDLAPDPAKNPDLTVIVYSLYKNRGWANLGLKYYAQAEADARHALGLRPEGAAAHCLMAQVIEARNDMQGALGWWQNCLQYEKLDTYVPVEARWLGLAHERLSEAAQK